MIIKATRQWLFTQLVSNKQDETLLAQNLFKDSVLMLLRDYGVPYAE